VQDDRGTILRRRKQFASIPHYSRFPVQTEADYDKVLPQLNGADAGRYPADFDEELHWRRARGEIIGLNFRAFFGFPRILMGLENLSVAFYEQPALVRRIITDRVRFARVVYTRVLATGAVDFVQVWEDMAFKTASLVSPKIVREIMLPAYADLTAMLRAGGVQVIMVDCDGHVHDLLPIYRESGMDGVYPCEIAAGSDPNVLRKIAPKTALMGGMDKRVIAAGKEGVEAELRRVAPLLSQGGFIPFLDHFVPPDVPYDTYRYYVERRREMLAKH
jgi:uroporphyrinogen decarboxylase